MTALATARELYAAGKLRDSIPFLQRACDEEPTNPEVYYRCGLALVSMRDYRAASRFLTMAIEYDPTSAPAQYNLGVALEASGQDHKAEKHYLKAIELVPDNAIPYVNLGGIAYRKGLGEFGKEYHDRALSIITDDPDQLGQRSFVRLMRGDYATGWAEYECRWQSAQVKATNWQPTRARRWTPPRTPYAERTQVLVYAEQGLGDAIQMLRYHDLLCALNVEPIYSVSPALYPIMPHGAQVVPPQFEPVGVTRSIPMLSLPLVFDTRRDTIPKRDGYLTRPDTLDTSPLQRTTRPLVGYCTYGNKDHMNDHDRSIPSHLRAFVETDVGHGIDWVCLDREECFFGLRDLGDTADVISVLDAVVTVDTSLFHLSAALGKRTYLLPPSSPEWRHGVPNPGKASGVPWYGDQVTAFWRHNTREWPGVLKRVCDVVRKDLA